MEVAHVKKKKKLIIIFYFICFHDKFLASPLLTSVEKNPEATTACPIAPLLLSQVPGTKPP